MNYYYNQANMIIEKENLDVDFVKNAILNSNNRLSKLSDNSTTSNNILNLAGMSSYKGRHLLNNLCNFKNCSYLEIGTYSGSTLCSALYRNFFKQIIACDNFVYNTQSFVEERFKENLKNFCSDKEISFFNEDCFSLDLSKIKEKINVYFYDGNHSYEDQYKAIVYYEPVFDDRILLIVDDFQEPQPEIGKYFEHTRETVRNATFKAIENINYNILFEAIMPPSVSSGKPQNINIDYWAGMYVALLEKNNG